MKGDKQWSSLTEFCLEDCKVALNGLKPRIIDFWSFIMHGYKIVIEFSDLFAFRLLSNFKGKLFKQLFEADRIGTIFGSKTSLKSLKLGEVA